MMVDLQLLNGSLEFNGDCKLGLGAHGVIEKLVNPQVFFKQLGFDEPTEVKLGNGVDEAANVDIAWGAHSSLRIETGAILVCNNKGECKSDEMASRVILN